MLHHDDDTDHRSFYHCPCVFGTMFIVLQQSSRLAQLVNATPNNIQRFLTRANPFPASLGQGTSRSILCWIFG
jgi:hypothetical protein